MPHFTGEMPHFTGEVPHFTENIVIIDRHQSDLNRPVSSSSDNVFKGLPSRLRQFGLQFSTIFAILLPFILVTRHSKFVLYLLSFSSTGSTFSCSKISSSRLWSKKGVTGCSSDKISSLFMSILFFVLFFYWSKCLFHIKEWGKPVRYRLNCYCWKFLGRGWFNVLFRIASMWTYVAKFC
jgi:hypothetical protein